MLKMINKSFVQATHYFDRFAFDIEVQIAHYGCNIVILSAYLYVLTQMLKLML